MKFSKMFLTNFLMLGKKDKLLKFFKLVQDGKFPLNNIAFELFLDIVQWFDKDESRQMRYSPSTLQFFWLGRKLFGGCFIRFMSGPKNESDILTRSSTPNRFLFVSLAVIQAIYEHCISKCFFVKSLSVPLSSFP